MIRYTKMLLTLAVALWGLLGGFGNLANYQEGAQSVEAVLSMETLPEDVSRKGHGEPPPFVTSLGFAFIWVLKLLGGSLCLIGLFRMWTSRNADVREFAAAKRWSIAGCGLLVFMLFFGFSLVAVGPFKLYLSPLISAVELAALFAAQIGIIMVFLHQPEC